MFLCINDRNILVSLRAFFQLRMQLRDSGLIFFLKAKLLHNSKYPFVSLLETEWGRREFLGQHPR